MGACGEEGGVIFKTGGLMGWDRLFSQKGTKGTKVSDRGFLWNGSVEPDFVLFVFFCESTSVFLC